MKNITIEYFAQFRDLANNSSEKLQTALSTAADLYDYLADQYQFPLGKEDVKVAINEDFASWGTSLNEGDTIVFIPPVAGG